MHDSAVSIGHNIVQPADTRTDSAARSAQHAIRKDGNAAHRRPFESHPTEACLRVTSIGSIVIRKGNDVEMNVDYRYEREPVGSNPCNVCATPLRARAGRLSSEPLTGPRTRVF
jgi:hypothetical protein